MNADTRRSATFWKGADDVPIDIIEKQAEDPSRPLGEGMNAVRFPVNR